MTLPQPPNRWDIEQIMSDRAQAVAACGFTERQARFLVTVMLHSGVFVERQYCTFANIVHGQKTADFLRKLVDGKFARTMAPGPLHRGRLIHVHHKPLYAAIGQTENRHRKPAELGRLIERVMVLDAVLSDQTVLWLGAERDKMSYFRRLLEDRFQQTQLPTLRFGTGPRPTLRYFPDKMPIGIRLREDPIVFVYLITKPTPFDFRIFLSRHAQLLLALPEWSLRLLAPRSLRKAVPRYLHAVREEYATPLPGPFIEEMKHYFYARRDRESKPGELPDSRLSQDRSGFGAPRFQALYRVWRSQGDAVFRPLALHALKDKFDRGVARVECVELERQYLHLSHLVGKS